MTISNTLADVTVAVADYAEVKYVFTSMGEVGMPWMVMTESEP